MRGSSDRGSKKPRRAGRLRRKACHFCVTPAAVIDHKQPEFLRSYLKERGKIGGRRATGVCAKHQRKLAKAIKRARQLSLLGFDAR